MTAVQFRSVTNFFKIAWEGLFKNTQISFFFHSSLSLSLFVGAVVAGILCSASFFLPPFLVRRFNGMLSMYSLRGMCGSFLPVHDSVCLCTSD